MANPQKDPMRFLTTVERAQVLAVARAPSERADRVARAKVLLAVAEGARLSDAAQAAGRTSAQGVAKLVARFNRQGLAALDGRHGGGPAVHYIGLPRPPRGQPTQLSTQSKRPLGGLALTVSLAQQLINGRPGWRQWWCYPTLSP